MIAIATTYWAVVAVVDLFLAIVALFGVVCLLHWAATAAWKRITRKHPAPYVPGEPLSEEDGGEAEQFAGLIWVFRNEDIPEPVYRTDQEAS